MRSNQHHSFHHQAGFSLVEILVGLVIGLIATLVIMQVFSAFEGQKRTTSGGSDAQTNGSIALYEITRELQMAGYGLPPIPAAKLGITVSPLKCTTPTWGAGVTDLSPVTITDGGASAGASDSITIRYGNSFAGAVPSLILPATTGTDIAVDNNMSCRVHDVAMIVSDTGAACAFTSVTGPTDIDDVLPVPSTPPKLTTVTVADDAATIGAAQNATLTCLGHWNVTTFRVNPTYDPTDTTKFPAYLERVDPLNVATRSVSDIVNIQAQYGISNGATSNQIVQWVDASGSWATTATTPTVADRNRIKAIHIAVVARNGLYEKDLVTSTCTTNQGTSNNGPCAWDDKNIDAAPKIDLSNDPNWQHYRYRVFETIIPLRNVIWSKGSL